MSLLGSQEAKSLKRTSQSLSMTDSVTNKCPYFQMPIESSHHCIKCKKQVHVFCGTGVREEGYGQKRICFKCKPPVSANDEPNLDKDKQENKNTTANEETNIDSNKQDNIENKTNKADDSVKPNKRKLVEEINIENGAKRPKRTPVNTSCIISGCDDQKSKAPIPKKCTPKTFRVYEPSNL